MQNAEICVKNASHCLSKYSFIDSIITEWMTNVSRPNNPAEKCVCDIFFKNDKDK